MQLSQQLHKLFRFSLPVLMLVLCIIIGVLNPVFFSLENLLNVLTQSSIITLIAVGMTIVIILGGIDLAVGAEVAVCGILLAMLLSAGFPVSLSICLAIMFGGTLGIINGVLVSYYKVPAFIATLGMMSAARGLALLLLEGRSISGFDNSFQQLASGTFIWIPIPVIVLFFISFLTILFLRNTSWGVRLYAIGDNQRAAWLAGIMVSRYHVAAYSFCGLLCGLASVILTSRLNSALPTAGIGYELDAIAAVVLGGARLSGGYGSVLGTICGALIIAVLKNGLTILDVSSYIQQILVGVVLVITVLVDSKSKGE